MNFNGKKLKIFVFVSAVMFWGSNVSFADTFSDVPENRPDYKAISKITSQHIMTAKSNGLFKPDDLLTRKEFASAVVKAVNLEGKPVEKVYSFNDFDKSEPEYKNVAIAINYDIITPIDDYTFSPNGYVTREDFIAFLVDLLKSEDITKKDALFALQNNYEDFNDVPDRFKVTAGKAAVLGVLANKPGREKYIDCDEYVTRAEAAEFLYKMKRIINAYLKEEYEKAVSPKVGEGIEIENTVLNGDVVTLPAQTVLPIVPESVLNSKTTIPGSMFNARFVNNITDTAHHIIFSKDVLLTGRILDAQKAGKFVKNGSMIIEVSATNKDGNLTRLFATAECRSINTGKSKIGKAYKNVVKGKNLNISQDDIIYIKLYKPIRVNIVTGDIFD